jgi:hypothetical protein
MIEIYRRRDTIIIDRGADGCWMIHAHEPGMCQRVLYELLHTPRIQFRDVCFPRVTIGHREGVFMRWCAVTREVQASGELEELLLGES